MSCRRMRSPLPKDAAAERKGYAEGFRFGADFFIIRLQVEIIAKIRFVRLLAGEKDGFVLLPQKTRFVCGNEKITAFKGRKPKHLSAFEGGFRGKIFIWKGKSNHRFFRCVKRRTFRKGICLTQSEEDFRCSRSVGTPVSEAVRGLCFRSHKIGKTESLYEGTE